MLFLPRNGLPANKSGTGYARGKSSTGYWLRGRASVINRNTVGMSRWRQIFSAAKMNWKSAVAKTEAGDPTYDVTPVQAWTAQAATYAGILQAGLYQGDIQQIGTLIGCSTVEAYEVMVQTTEANANSETIAEPVLNTSYLASSTTSQNQSVGSYTASLHVPTMPPPNPLSFSVSASISITGNNTTTWTAAVSTAPSGVTATLSATSFALVYNSLGGTSEGGINVTLTLDANTDPLTGSINITLTGPGGTATFTVELAVTTGTQVPVTPSPTFAFPNKMYATTVYDSNYNVTGFALTYSAIDVTEFPMKRYGVEIEGVWLITASAAYTSSYSKPATSTWKFILAKGPYMPTAATLLAAWEAVYGTISSSGDIAFQAQYADTATGCPGPALSCTASWKNGTLKSANISGWTGKKFTVTNESSSGNVAAGGSAPLSINVQGANGYSGTITFSVKAKSALPTGANSKTYALPTGITFTITPATLTIASGDTSVHNIVATAPIPADIANYEFKAELEGTDNIETAGGSATFQITGGTGTLPPKNYLYMNPATVQLYVAAGSTNMIKFTIGNEDSNEQFVTMIASNSNTDLTTAFGTGGSASATATATTITFALATGSNVNSLIGSTLTSSGYTPAGYNNTGAPIISNDASTVTVSSTNNPNPMTTEGIAAVIDSSVTVPGGSIGTPGTATVYLYVTSAATLTNTLTTFQVEVSAGNYTTYSIVNTAAPEYDGTSLDPFTVGPLLSAAGTATQVYTLGNETNSSVTVEFAASGVPSGASVSFSPNPVSLAAGSTNNPATATTTMTVTIASGQFSLGETCVVNATATGYSQTSYVSLS
jgi:hypothetical protein